MAGLFQGFFGAGAAAAAGAPGAVPGAGVAAVNALDAAFFPLAIAPRTLVHDPLAIGANRANSSAELKHLD